MTFKLIWAIHFLYLRSPQIITNHKMQFIGTKSFDSLDKLYIHIALESYKYVREFEILLCVIMNYFSINYVVYLIEIISDFVFCDI